MPQLIAFLHTLAAYPKLLFDILSALKETVYKRSFSGHDLNLSCVLFPKAISDVKRYFIELSITAKTKYRISSVLYISTIGLAILLEEICRRILGLYKSLTDT
jgi:hypothetical protein